MVLIVCHMWRFYQTGHLLAGTIKDTVTRYAHQMGHHVVR